jgi:hypothetical protein
MGGPQSQTGWWGEEKNLSRARNRTLAIHPVTCPYTHYAIQKFTEMAVEKLAKN